jgi:hypothetical protein
MARENPKEPVKTRRGFCSSSGATVPGWSQQAGSDAVEPIQMEDVIGHQTVENRSTVRAPQERRSPDGSRP